MNKTEKQTLKDAIAMPTESSPNVEKQEALKFIREVKNHFAENFPFLADEDRQAFLKKFDGLIEEDSEVDAEADIDVAVGIDAAADVDIDLLIKKIKQIIVTLDNSHVDISEKDGVKKLKLDKELYYKAGTVWVDVDDEPLEVVSINDTPIGTLIDQEVQDIGGGTLEWKKYKAVNALMLSSQASDVIIIAKNGAGEKFEVDSKFMPNGNKRFVTKVENGVERPYKIDDYLEAKMLDGDISYLRIDSWSKKIEIDGKNIAQLAEEELEKLKASKAIIIDVRENDGGNSHYAHIIASHFLREKVECCHMLIKKAGQKEMIEHQSFVGPEGEYYDQKVVILTGAKCISATDMFLTFLKDTGRAISIGQTTGGGSGNPQPLDLQLGKRKFELRVSCWRNYRNNGVEIENNGIEPDIYVEPNPADVRAHRDVELEKAVEYLRKNK